MRAVVRMTRERRVAEIPTTSRGRRSTDGQTTQTLINCLIPYQDQGMILIHQIIPETLNRRSNSPTREKTVEPVERYREIVPDQAMKKTNGPLSVRLSMESHGGIAQVNLPESWETTKKGNKSDGGDDQHSNCNTLQRTHDSVCLTTSMGSTLQSSRCNRVRKM